MLRGVVREYPSVVSVAITFVVATAILLAADTYYGHLADRREADATGWPYAPVKNDYGAMLTLDPEVKYVLTPSRVTQARKVCGSDVIADFTCSTDAFGRRITPNPHPEFRESFLICFGDSFTFGEGVEDDETFPACLARLTSNHMVYNYGVGGYGPAQMILRADRIHWKEEISEPNGIILYTFIGAHVGRTIGALRVLTWGAELPSVRFDEAGELIYEGSFEKAHPWRCAFMRGLLRSGFVRYKQLNFPLRQTYAHCELTARVIAELKRRLLRQFPEARFVVAIYPSVPGQPLAEKALLAQGLETINLERMVEEEVMKLPNEGLLLDRHPTPENYALCAQRLVAELGLNDATPLARTESILDARVGPQ